MLARQFFALTLLLSVLAVGEVSGQDRTEKITRKSTCFSSKIQITVTHCSPDKKDGSIEIELPRSVSNAKIFWIGHRVAEESKSLQNIKPGFYTAVIFDQNNCSTRLENIEVK